MPGFVLKYCCQCNKRIPEEDFAAGSAVEWMNRTYCKEHVPEEARAAAAAARSSTGLRIGPSGRSTAAVTRRTQRISSRSARPATPPPGRSNRVTTKRRTRPSDRTDAMYDDDSDMLPAGPKKTGLIVGVVVLCVVLVAILMVVAMSGGQAANNTTSNAAEQLTNKQLDAPNQNNTDADAAARAAVEAREKAARLKKEVEDLTALISQMSRRYDDFVARQSTMPEDQRKQEALAGLRDARTLVRREGVLVAEGSRLEVADSRKLKELLDGVDGWAEMCVRAHIATAIRRADEMAEQQRYDEALKLLADVRDGRGSEIPAEVLEGKAAQGVLKQLVSMSISRIETLRDKPVPARDPKDQQLEEINSMMREARELMKSGDEATVRRVRDITARMRTIGNDILGDRNYHGWNAVNEYFGELFTWFDRSLGNLARQVDRSDQAAVDRLVEHLRWVLGQVNRETPMGAGLAATLRDLSGSDSITPPPAAGSGTLGKWGKELEQAVAGSDIDRIILAEIRVRWFVNRHDVSAAATERVNKLKVKACEKICEWLKANAGADDKILWRRRALLFIDSMQRDFADQANEIIAIINNQVGFGLDDFEPVRQWFATQLPDGAPDIDERRDLWWQFCYMGIARTQNAMRQVGQGAPQFQALVQIFNFYTAVCMRQLLATVPDDISKQRRDIQLARINQIAPLFQQGGNEARQLQAQAQRLQGLAPARAVSPYKD
ncbi:MAG: hypothetical protein AB7K09_10500 [Planctomycetota bacterium]